MWLQVAGQPVTEVFGDKLIQDLAGNAFQNNCFMAVAICLICALAIATKHMPTTEETQTDDGAVVRPDLPDFMN